MGLFARLLDRLREPLLVGIDVDGAQYALTQAQILERKPLAREVFHEVAATCRRYDERLFSGSGPRVELGAGAGSLRTVLPASWTSDAKLLPNLDLVLDAHRLGLADESVGAVYGVHLFHHLHAPELFLRELDRVLRPGGGCVLVEPYHGPLAAFFYARAFENETFDPEQRDWRTDPAARGLMSGANQALSYIAFVRDRDRFELEHPSLELVLRRRLGCFVRYLAGGGLTFRQLLPHWSAPLLRMLEILLAPAGHLVALHHVVVLRKRPR